MTALVARLDPCVNWMKLVSSTHGRILWIFPAVLVGGYLWSVNWGDALSGLSEQRFHRAANSSLLGEARRLGLGFEAVISNPAQAIGKPVMWCVSSKDGEHGFVDEKATMPVVWMLPSENLRTSLGSYGYCWKELAIDVIEYTWHSHPTFQSLQVYCLGGCVVNIR